MSQTKSLRGYAAAYYCQGIPELKFCFGVAPTQDRRIGLSYAHIEPGCGGEGVYTEPRDGVEGMSVKYQHGSLLHP